MESRKRVSGQSSIITRAPVITRSMSRKMRLSSSRTPTDLIFDEILPRASVKSLLRCKCVSRSWLSHIATNSFAKKHLQHSKNKTLTDQNAILVNGVLAGNDFMINHCLAGSLFSRETLSVDDFESQRMGRIYPMIVGCCNGLCCLLIGRNYFLLWNPSTRECRRLPTVLNELSYVNLHGFGYDESNDDFKVLALFNQKVFRLYSLKTNSWKPIKDFLGGDTLRGDVTFGLHGAFLDGKLHWISDHSKIISFDLGTEAAGVVELPSSEDRGFKKVRVMKGCLAVYCDIPNEGTEIWAMKEYGVKESWYRVMIIPYLGTIVNRPCNFLLCISEDRVVLKDIDHSVLIIYNPKTQSVKRLEFEAYLTFMFDFCIQSLISPFRHGELEETNELAG